MAPARTEEPNYDDTTPFMRSCAAAEVIFREGDADTDLFIVQDGRVELLKGASAVPVGTAAEGDLVGEWSFFEQQPRDVTARALTEVTLIRLDRAAFERVTGESPDAAVRMLQKVARALHDRRQATPAMVAAQAEPEPAAAFLIEERSGTRFVLTADDAHVGRMDRASGMKPEIDLTSLDTERTLSRRHARIVRRDDAYFLREETSSRNGTFVNGKRVDAGIDIELHDGDEVRFGLVKTIFRWH